MGHTLKLYTPGGNPEIIQINQLKRIVSLTAKVTERARFALLLPLVCGFVNVFWTIFSTGGSFTQFLVIIINWSTKVIIPAFLPAIFALVVTYKGQMLDRLVTLSSFLNLATFVQGNPSEWMIAQRTPLSLGLLARLSAAVVV